MILGAINGLITAGKQKRESNRIKPVEATYSESPYAKQRLAMAQMRLNARMGGAGALGRNIAQSQANTMGVISRNAGDSGQALAAAAAAQGQTNQSLADLQVREAMDYGQKVNNLESAQMTMVQEGDKVFNDKLRKYLEARRAKDALMQSSLMNKQAAFNSLDNTISQVAGMALGGGFKKAPKTDTSLLGS